MKELKDLIKLPVISERNIIMDAEGRTSLVVDFTHPNAKEICTALCTLINAQNADVGKLAEEYAEKKHSNSDPKNALLNAIKEDLIDAVLYGSNLNSAEEKKGYEWLSPVKSEREYQEQILKRFFPEYPNICHWQVMNALIMCLLKNENIERSAEKESTLNSGAKELQLASLRPLRKLAEDKEMCEVISRLCGHEIREVINKGDRIYFDLHDCEDLTIFFNGDIGSSMVYTPIIQICALISSRYKIGE